MSLAILGGILFLVTAVLDYYWSRHQTDQSTQAETPTSPDKVPVGSKPPEENGSIQSKIEPRYVGYLLAVVLQLPALASQMGWI